MLRAQRLQNSCEHPEKPGRQWRHQIIRGSKTNASCGWQGTLGLVHGEIIYQKVWEKFEADYKTTKWSVNDCEQGIASSTTAEKKQFVNIRNNLADDRPCAMKPIVAKKNQNSSLGVCFAFDVFCQFWIEWGFNVRTTASKWGLDTSQSLGWQPMGTG